MACMSLTEKIMNKGLIKGPKIVWAKNYFQSIQDLFLRYVCLLSFFLMTDSITEQNECIYDHFTTKEIVGNQLNNVRIYFI